VIVMGAVAIALSLSDVRALEYERADLRRRLLATESVRPTQTQALQTIDAMARASRGARL